MEWARSCTDDAHHPLVLFTRLDLGPRVPFGTTACRKLTINQPPSSSVIPFWRIPAVPVLWPCQRRLGRTGSHVVRTREGDLCRADAVVAWARVQVELLEHEPAEQLASEPATAGDSRLYSHRALGRHLSRRE